ncbi:Beta-galactosidase [Paenibacillus allorhizoplanae]|uniref:Beta-galactosidase n=1 Tax=Paenibacillus allorhizoplanae TaxID=2905648 RepID=A0ABM9CQ50_9BACL|nr:family 16 glycoside hydrolase [Paenibacillus allorhizoplanae]CAH1219847.1 Beta-galactosidase [Paenibacillus allorhizoplanae]
MRIPWSLGKMNLRIVLVLFTSLLISTLFAVTNSAHADTSREQVSLNGVWDFYPNGGSTRFDITVPSYWDSSAGFGYPTSWNTLNYGVYKRNFTVPSSMTGKEIFLDLENIGPLSKVFVNGTQLATETDGYLMTRLPYKLDITPLAIVGGTNTLEVRVWGYYALPADAKDASGKSLYPIGVDNQSWGQGRGINDDVALVAYPKVFVSDTFVITDLKNNTSPSDDEITVKTTVTNATAISQTVTVTNSAQLVGGSTEKTFSDQTVTVAANSSQTVTWSAVPWTNAKYWWTHDPKLYNLNTSLTQGVVTIDSLATRFGFRQFAVNTNYYQLNGIKTNLRGDALQFNWATGSGHGAAYSSSQSYANASIAEVKLTMDEWKTTYNVARTHIHGGIKQVYDYADEIGLLLIDETPYWQYHSVHSYTTDAMDHITKWVKQWVNARKNHASIVIWSGGNENWSSTSNNTTILHPTIAAAITSIDTSKPIIQDDFTTADQENHHYTGGYQIGWLNNSTMYGLYTNNSTKPKGEGEAYTPSGGWPTLNANGTYNSTLAKDIVNDNLVSQAVWHRAADRMTRAMRYAGFADIRYYANWIYAYEVTEDTLYPTWSDMTAPGLKPVAINRPVFNAYDSARPAFIKSDSYEYTHNTYSPVAAFDKDGDKNNLIGASPLIFSGGTATTRTIIVYNDEQQDGTSVDVNWEAGYVNPVNGTYTSFQIGTFNVSVPYGNKVEQAISFTPPTGVSAQWLQLKLTAKKGTITKFQETNRLGALGSIPAAKIEVPASINVGVKNVTNSSQKHKLKIVNKGGGLSTNWTVSGHGDWLGLTQSSGNLRGEREIYFTINTVGLAPNSSYSKTLTFSEDGGTSDTVTISFQTDGNPGTTSTSSVTLLSDDFESGSAAGWSTTSGTWGVITDGTKVYNQTNTTVGGAAAFIGDSTWQHYSVSARLKADAFDAGNYAGIGVVARYVDSSNYYAFMYYKLTNTLKITKLAAGVASDVVTMPYSLSTGTWYDFKAVVNGSTLELWVNGTKQLTGTDTALTSGKIGMYAHRANAKFDNVSVAPIFGDDYESGSASSWATTGGTWSVVTDGTKVFNQSNNAAASVNAYSGLGTWQNYTVAAKVKADSFDAGNLAGLGLIARRVDANNYYTFMYYKSTNSLKILKVVGGTPTDLVTVPFTFTLGTWYDFKAVVNGSTLELWVNGTKLLTTTDTSFTSGQIGLYSHRASSKFDNVNMY